MADRTGGKALKCPNCGANAEADSVRCGYCGARLMAAACPACFGAVFLGTKFCPHCGEALDRSDETAERKMPCPRCGKDLEPAMIGEVWILECGECGGIWLDKETFREICDVRDKKALPFPGTACPDRSPRADKPARMYIPCPVCGELMNRKNFAGCSGVIIDWCRQHGMWFDRTELQQVADFIRDGGMQKARAIEIERLREKQRELAGLEAEQDSRFIRELMREAPSGAADPASAAGILFLLGRGLFS